MRRVFEFIQIAIAVLVIFIVVYRFAARTLKIVPPLFPGLS